MAMQAPPIPHNKKVTRDRLDQLIDEHAPLPLALNQAKAAVGGAPGGWQRSVAPDTSLDVRDKVAEIQHQLNTDIDTVDHMCTAHSLFIQDLVDRAKAYMISTKRAVEA